MKHVKEFEGNRKFKPYKKYTEHLAYKFDANICEIFELDEIITISLEYYREIDKETFLLLYDYFKNTNFHILKGPVRMKFEATNVPKSFFEKFDLEIDANNYNL